MKTKTSLRGLIQNTIQCLSGNWWRSIAVLVLIGFLLYGLQMWIFAGQIHLMVNGFSPLGLFFCISGVVLLGGFCGPLLTGGASYFLSVAKNKKLNVGSIFSGFDYFGRSIGVFWVTAVMVFLWSLLFGAVMLGVVLGLGALTGASMLMAAGGEGAAGPFVMSGLVMFVPMILWTVGFLWIFFRHSLVFFAFADHPDEGVFETVKQGIATVRGNYGKLFGAWILMFLILMGCSLVLSVIMIALSLSGQMIVAVVINSIAGILIAVISSIFPPAFLAVLYADCKN